MNYGVNKNAVCGLEIPTATLYISMEKKHQTMSLQREGGRRGSGTLSSGGEIDPQAGRQEVTVLPGIP